MCSLYQELCFEALVSHFKGSVPEGAMSRGLWGMPIYRDTLPTKIRLSHMTVMLKTLNQSVFRISRDCIITSRILWNKTFMCRKMNKLKRKLFGHLCSAERFPLLSWSQRLALYSQWAWNDQAHDRNIAITVLGVYGPPAKESQGRYWPSGPFSAPTLPS